MRSSFRTHITPAVHISELVQMRFDSSQVVLLHEGEQTLDGQRRHLEGGGGVHGSTLASCAPLEGRRRSESGLWSTSATDCSVFKREWQAATFLFFDDVSGAHVHTFSICSYTCVCVCINVLCGVLDRFTAQDLTEALGSVIQIISVRLFTRKTRGETCLLRTTQAGQLTTLDPQKFPEEEE